jgi:hypothetical protein
MLLTICVWLSRSTTDRLKRRVPNGKSGYINAVNPLGRQGRAALDDCKHTFPVACQPERTQRCGALKRFAVFFTVARAILFVLTPRRLKYVIVFFFLNMGVVVVADAHIYSVGSCIRCLVCTLRGTHKALCIMLCRANRAGTVSGAYCFKRSWESINRRQFAKGSQCRLRRTHQWRDCPASSNPMNRHHTLGLHMDRIGLGQHTYHLWRR